jgi:hypothetical protein
MDEHKIQVTPYDIGLLCRDGGIVVAQFKKALKPVTEIPALHDARGSFVTRVYATGSR